MAATNESARIPVVDFSQVAINLKDDDIDPLNLDSCAAQIVEALGTIGFVYLRNHGIPKEQVQEAFHLSEQFFSLHPEIKRNYEGKSFQEFNHGFMGIGEERLDDNFAYEEIRECFHVDFLHGFAFPTEVEGFQKMVVNFFASCSKLSRRVLTLIGVGLKIQAKVIILEGRWIAFLSMNPQMVLLDKFFLNRCHSTDMGSTENKTALRFLFYPPVVKKADVIRCGEHSDYGSVTLLFEDDSGGLQVKHRDGTYVDATPIEGCVLINIGDLMQRWTADKLVSTKHRVRVPNSEELGKKARYSIAFFVNPDTGTLVECLDKSNKYPPIKSEDYLSRRFLETYTGQT